MKEQIADLGFLENRYKEEVAMLENKLAEVRKRLSVVSDAIELLRREGRFDQNTLIQLPHILSEKYKNMKMREAIENILRSSQGKKVSAQFIISELENNGFKTKSKNLRRDVYTTLLRLQKNLLGYRKEGGLKKYFLKEDKIEEDVKNEKGGI